jgi:HAD superfamily hydrolase (TIGR01548 family)
LIGALRITLPGNAAAFERLVAALTTVLAPEALVFDLDGVLADVQHSQRAAIAATAQAFGVTVTSAQVAAAIRAGDAANDWIVTQRLIESGGREVPLDDVTARFQALYIGDTWTPGLRERERLIPNNHLLERLAAHRRLAIVTGRPRAEAHWFLERAGVAHLFGAVIAMEDAAPKPDPAPVRLALARLGVNRAWMIGDTPDDVRAAAQAGVVPLCVVAPGDEPSLAIAALQDAGAARVLDQLTDLLDLLP